MRCTMPQPVQIGSTYYLRVHVPRDVLGRAAGTTVSLPIGGRICQLKLTTHAKVSLRTKDWAEAKRRFSQALAALESHWETLRTGTEELTQRQAYALAGELAKTSSMRSRKTPAHRKCGSGCARWMKTRSRGSAIR